MQFVCLFYEKSYRKVFKPKSVLLHMNQVRDLYRKLLTWQRVIKHTFKYICIFLVYNTYHQLFEALKMETTFSN